MSIPNKVSASSILTHAHVFAGELPASSMPRLAAAIGKGDGKVSVNLQAGRENTQARLRGVVTGALPMLCVRCEKPYIWPMNIVVDVRLVFSERDERRALQGSDPYLLENDELPVRELVEDEILLALPMLARCETCENALSEAAALAAKPGRAEPRNKVATNNPFADLKGRLK